MDGVLLVFIVIWMSILMTGFFELFRFIFRMKRRRKMMARDKLARKNYMGTR